MHARETSVAILEGVNGEEFHGERGDDDERVKLFVAQGLLCPADQVGHVLRGIKRHAGLEDYTEFFAIGIESGDVIAEGFVGAAVAVVFVTVTQEVGV